MGDWQHQRRLFGVCRSHALIKSIGFVRLISNLLIGVFKTKYLRHDKMGVFLFIIWWNFIQHLGEANKDNRILLLHNASLFFFFFGSI